ISGKATLANGRITLPTEDIAASPAPQFPIDPTFDIGLSIVQRLNIKSQQADIDLSGDGSVGGSLRSPQLSANLVVQKGTFRLPTSKVTLDPDGTVRPSYHPGAADGHDARIDVDLEGRTRVTAKGPTGRPQPYDIRLTIQGDLLRDGGLALDATS